MFKILVDADACPVIDIVESIAKKYGISVTLLCDTNHVLTSAYSEVKVIGAGADAVDFALVNLCSKGDIVLTQDYGVAAMALGKGAQAIHQSGRVYTQDSIDQLLFERHLAKKVRSSKGKHHLKGPRKRTSEDDERFAKAFENLLAWDPDFTRLTPEEEDSLRIAEAELARGETVLHDEIDWDNGSVR